jgi:uncharacterized protein YoxC
MESILVPVTIAALVALIVLIVYLIAVLVRVRGILTVVETDLKQLTSRAIPVLENMEVITEKVKTVTESIDEQMESVKYSIQSIREISDSIATFERRIQEKIEEPVIDTVGTIAAVLKGFQAFMSRLRA